MEIYNQYLLIVLIISIVFGIFAQMSQFCLLGGIRSVVNKNNTHRMWTYIIAMAVAILGSNIIEFNDWVNLNDTKPPYRTLNFAYGRYILGGFIFGVGMVLSSGCGMRNLVYVGQGNLRAFLVVAVMALSAYAMINLSVYSEVFLPIVEPFTVQFTSAGSQDIATLISKKNPQIFRLILAAVIFSTVLLFAIANKKIRQARFLIGSFGVGLVIVAGFTVTGGDFGQLLIEEADFMAEPPRGLATQSFSFAAPMADTVYALIYQEGWSVITFGVIAVIGLPIGAFLSSLFRKEFKISGITINKSLFTHVFGAVLVGIGSVLAMGCTVGHGLTGVSTFALGSFVTLFFIIIGARTMLKFR